MAQKAELLPAYLVVGPDELKRKQTLVRLRARVEGPFEAFNLEEVQVTADLEPQAVISSLNTLPMGADRRVVIVEDAGKLAKPVSEAIVAYLKDPNPACTLCLVAMSLAKNTRLYKAVAKVGPKAVIKCEAMKARELPPHVQRMATAHGISIDRQAAEELVARVGDSTIMLDNQLATLAGLMGGSGTVTCEFVEANVARVVEVKPWEFLNRLSQRDVVRSLELLRLMDGSALGLLSLVTGRLRELTCARALDARGEGRQVASELKKQDWQVKDYVRWARGFAHGELESLLGECAAAERALKTGADPDAVMVPLVVRICGA